MSKKKYDLQGIITDVKRLCGVFNNPKHLHDVAVFLKNNFIDSENGYDCDRKIVREDMQGNDKITKYNITVTPHTKLKSENRICNTMQAVTCGMNEKSIITLQREHYKTIHPTQKPVRLLERLLNLVCDKDALVLDPFMGSASTAAACINTGRKYIGFEIDKEYYDKSCDRISGLEVKA